MALLMVQDKKGPRDNVIRYFLYNVRDNGSVSIFFVGNVLSSKPSLISSSTQVYFPSFDASSVMGIMNYVYYFLGIISYVTMWTASVLLLVTIRKGWEKSNTGLSVVPR